jgi:hypothetical protein
MRALDMQDIGDRQIEIAVIVRQSGETCAGDRNAVVRLTAADDFLLGRPVAAFTKNAFDTGTGAMLSSFLASTMPTSFKNPG